MLASPPTHTHTVHADIRQKQGSNYECREYCRRRRRPVADAVRIAAAVFVVVVAVAVQTDVIADVPDAGLFGEHLSERFPGNAREFIRSRDAGG